MLVILIAWAFIGPAHVFYLEMIDVVRPRGTAVAALGSLWMIEGAAWRVGNAVGGIVAEWSGPHVTLALGSLFALFSPIIFTVGIRGVAPSGQQGGPRRTDATVDGCDDLSRASPASDCIAPGGCP